jgi:hypothetical protein
MFCKLGLGASSSRSTTASSNHYRRIRSDEATRFDDWSADPNHDQSSRTGGNSDAANSGQPGSNAHRPGSTGQSQYADGAVSNIAGDSGAKWCGDRNNSSCYNSCYACTDGTFSAGRGNFSRSSNTVEQSWDESAVQRRNYSFGK